MTTKEEPMKRIEKKIWPEYFDKVASGQKTFEYRLDDFECEPGDMLESRLAALRC